jgi:hypothetical protein
VADWYLWMFFVPHHSTRDTVISAGNTLTLSYSLILRPMFFDLFPAPIDLAFRVECTGKRSRFRLLHRDLRIAIFRQKWSKCVSILIPRRRNFNNRSESSSTNQKGQAGLNLWSTSLIHWFLIMSVYWRALGHSSESSQHIFTELHKSEQKRLNWENSD